MPAMASAAPSCENQPSVPDVAPVAPVQHPCQQAPALTPELIASLPPAAQALSPENQLHYLRSMEEERQWWESILAGPAEVRPDPLIVRTDAVYHVNLWLLTLAATLATRPVLPDISALNATAQDNVPMTLARGMQRVPWSLEPVNELEIERFFYGDEQDAAALCQTEEGRRYWDWLRTRPGRRPDFDPGQRPPGFINLLPDTQRGWDQPSRCRALEWDIQRERARAALWRGVPDGPITPAPARVLMGDLARDQSTDSDSSATDKQQGLQEPEQPQQSEQASGEAHSAAGQEQPLTPTQPTKSAKKAGLCERLVCAAERKACRWKAKAGRAVDFVQAKVGEALDFIMSI